MEFKIVRGRSVWPAALRPRARATSTSAREPATSTEMRIIFPLKPRQEPGYLLVSKRSRPILLARAKVVIEAWLAKKENPPGLIPAGPSLAH